MRRITIPGRSHIGGISLQQRLRLAGVLSFVVRMPSVRTVLFGIGRFCFCAIPGAAILLVLAPVLLIPSTGPPKSQPRALEIVEGIALLPIGAAMVLYGTNQWGKWLYVAPLLGVIPFIFAFGEGSCAVQAALLMLPFLLAWGTREYYRRRDERHV